MLRDEQASRLPHVPRFGARFVASPRHVDGVNRAESLGNEDPSKPPSFSLSSSKVRPVRYTSRNIQILLVGRLGLDTSAGGVFLERPGTSLSVHICWLEEVECPPTSFEVLSRLSSWLDSKLDEGSFQGESTIQFRGSDREVFDRRLGTSR